MILPTPVLGPVRIFINAHVFHSTYMHNMSTYRYDITYIIYICL